jgi:hypothetical protein
MMRSNIKEARASIERLRLALLSPSPGEIVLALPGLEDATNCLAHIQQGVREIAGAPYEVRRELKMLKNDLRIIGRLIEQGIAFCQGWAKILGAGPAYTQAGLAAPGRPEGTLSLRG